MTAVSKQSGHHVKFVNTDELKRGGAFENLGLGLTRSLSYPSVERKCNFANSNVKPDPIETKIKFDD